jgi:holo-[acyl-carrier-protein] synthase
MDTKARGLLIGSPGRRANQLAPATAATLGPRSHSTVIVTKVFGVSVRCRPLLSEIVVRGRRRLAGPNRRWPENAAATRCARLDRTLNGNPPMIHGIGTDLCDIRRIAAALARRGERFAAKVLAPGEFAVWQARTAKVPERGLRYLATRFAAKEAFAKAIGLGIHWPMTWRTCEVVNLPGGRPAIRLHGELQRWFDERALVAHLSLTDETDHAMAFVVVEKA